MNMRFSWAQPSLSRDFVLLSLVVLVALGLISGWVTYSTYEKHYDSITTDLNKESIRIEKVFSTELGDASYMLASLGRQIAIDNERDYTKLAQSLTSFDSKNNIYSILSWINTDKKIVVSSNRGVLEDPVDISDRDFIQKAAIEPWKMHIGRPIEGRVSGRWVIPVAMGITDYTGKLMGIVSISIDIIVLTEQIRDLVKRDGISFAVISRNVSKDLIILTEISNDPDFIKHNFDLEQIKEFDFEKNIGGLLTKGNPAWASGTYAYYRVAENFPYIILMGYEANFSDKAVRNILWSRLLQIFIVAIFFVVFLWIVRIRVINPVLDMTTTVSSLVKGDRFSLPVKKNSVEMEALATQLKNVAQYIDETRRIEDELRNKMFLLKKAKENAEFNVRSKSEFLAYIAQDMRMPINNIIGFSQVLKDQVYGAIENRKYKQYANDIYVIANQLIAKIQDILQYSKIDNGYVTLQENNLEVISIVNASLRQIADKLHINKISVKVDLHEPLPRLLADEFRMQQILINLLLASIERIELGSVVTLEVVVLNEYREQQFMAFMINRPNAEHFGQKELSKLAEALSDTTYQRGSKDDKKLLNNEYSDLRLEIARILINLHGGKLYVDDEIGEISRYILFFPASRLVFQD